MWGEGRRLMCRREISATSIGQRKGARFGPTFRGHHGLGKSGRIKYGKKRALFLFMPGDDGICTRSTRKREACVVGCYLSRASQTFVIRASSLIIPLASIYLGVRVHQLYRELCSLYFSRSETAHSTFEVFQCSGCRCTDSAR